MKSGDVIKRIRESIGYSEEQFGNAINHSEYTVVAFEANRLSPTLADLKAMSRISRIPLGILYFLGQESPVNEPGAIIDYATVQEHTLDFVCSTIKSHIAKKGG